MRKPFTGLGLSLAVAVIGLLTACNDRPPVAPTPTAPQGPTGPALHRLEIVGPRSVAPGESVQFSAMGHFDDGSTRDLTREAMWRTSPPLALTVDASGRATGHVFGESILHVQAGRIAGVTAIVVVPAGTFKLSVLVGEAGFSLGNARVEVKPDTGARPSGTSPVGGRFDFYGVAGPMELRVAKEGYREHIQRLSISDHVVLDVEMAPVRPRVDVSGLFTLTITAHEACRDVLPKELRVRRYVAQITQHGPSIYVALEGADFRGNVFIGTMSADSSVVSFFLSYYDYYSDDKSPQPSVIERLSGDEYLAFAGSALTSVGQGTLSGTFDGSIRFAEVTPEKAFRTVTECASSRHAFVLAR